MSRDLRLEDLYACEHSLAVRVRLVREDGSVAWTCLCGARYRVVSRADDAELRATA